MSDWVAIKLPKPWKPSESGEAIEGRYVGRSTKSGMYGPFEVVTVRTTEGDVWQLAGRCLFFHIDHAALRIGEELRIVFKGKQKSKDRKSPMREFEVFVRAEKS